MSSLRAVFGGTFDPPHVGHLVVAHVAWEQLDVGTVAFLPAGDPWQKADRRVSPASVRARMVEAAINGIGHFELDLREVEADGPTYTIETVESYEDDVVMILGADAAAGIGTWHRAGELLERVEVAVVGRPGTPRRAVEEAVGASLRWLDMPALDISSSELRAWLGAGSSGRFIVPDAVREIIVAEGLYLPDRNERSPVH